MSRRHSAWGLLALLFLLLVIAGCRREPADTARAPGDPVAAVEGLAQALRDNDLVRWSKLSLPPDLHRQSEALWLQRQAQAEPPTAEEAADYAETMARLTAEGAERDLMRDLEPKLDQFESELAGQWPLMQAAAGVFIKAAIEANTDIGAAEKAHATEVVEGLLAWARPELIADRERAREAIAALTATARELELPTLDAARRLEMLPMLEKAGIALAGGKQIARAYGLDLDASLDGMRTELVSAEGDSAVVRVSYPFLDRTLSVDLEMLRRDGGWYSAEAIRSAEADIAEAATGDTTIALVEPVDADDGASGRDAAARDD